MPPTQKEILRKTAEALEATLARFQDNPRILQQLASVNAQLGRFDAASIQIYQRAADANPTDLKIQQALSISYSITQGSQILADVTALPSIDPAALRRSIERLLALKQEFPDSPEIHRAIGDLYLIEGLEKEAIQYYRSSITLGFGDLEVLAQQCEALQRLRPLGNGLITFLAEVYQRTAAHDKAESLFEAFAFSPQTERQIVDSYYEFLERRFEDAIDAEDETLFHYIRRLTRLSLMRGNFQETIGWARRLSAEQLAIDAPVAKELARRLLALEDFPSAFAYLSAMPVDDESKALLNEMTVTLEKRGELDTAVYVLQFINNHDSLSSMSVPTREVVRNEQRQSDILIEIETELQMAGLHWKNRRWDQAFGHYMRVLELGYEDYRSILEPLDLLITRVGDLGIRQLSFLMNFFADRRDWRRALGYALRAQGVDPAAPGVSQRLLQAAERIILESPEDLEVRLIHGDEHLRLGNIERAMQEYRKAAAAPEFKMKANRRLALANFRAGDILGAFDRYRDLPILEAEDHERLYDLAIAFANSQQYKEAFEAAKMIREYDPKFRDIESKYAEYENRMNESANGFVIDQRMRELIGDHSIGRYKYGAKIGSGGMGVVHRVLDLKTNTVVAMKILREGLSSSGKAIDRFFREARIAATLRHPNIVNIIDYNISNNYGQSYIAMEFIDGPSLRDVVEKKFSQSVDVGIADILQMLDWTSQLCDALDATHKKGIIHRDIKPDNIMLAPGEVIKITDFGIVHIEEATFTPTGALIGTPRYMSPEQVHGGRIDARSDIYAVGIIMYELLVGSPPYISGDISYQQVNVLPTPPRDICPVIPQSVDRIIMKCLEKNPGDRYQRSLECKQDVDEAYMRLGGDPARRRPSSSPEAPSLAPLPRATAAPAAVNRPPAISARPRDPRSESPTEHGEHLDSEFDIQ